MEKAQERFFRSHPDPMWVYDLATLRFLDVNDAAIAKYGYARDEFLAMTIADIRPPEDVEALTANVATVTEGRDEAGIWRHRLKSGAIIHVDITSHTVDYEGQRAEVVAARDVTRLVEAEQAAREALDRERESRKTSETLAQQFRALFESVPGKFLVLAPDSLIIIAASDEYLAATGVRREDVIGRKVLDVFPAKQGRAAHQNLRESLDRVAASGAMDVMPVQYYAIPRPDDPAIMDDRYWSPVNSPLIGQDGQVLYIFHRVEDVTDAVLAGYLAPNEPFEKTAETAGLDILLRSSELKSENRRLAEQAVRLRTAQRLLGIGYWDYDIKADQLTWSDSIHVMYGVPVEDFGGGFEDYVALVHPDDRSAMRENYAAFVDSGGDIFEFAHRIRRPDGWEIHVHGIAERVRGSRHDALTGVVQDVTERVKASAALARANRLLEIAGESAKFGAWRYDARSETLEWSPQTARIHEEPHDTVPTVASGIDYYAPEYRARITEVFNACLALGEPFDEVLQIVTGKDRRIWVRSTGEAERDEAGRIVAVQGAFQDISELVAAREEARQSSKRLAETLENIGDAFLTIDRKWRFTFLNSRAEELLERDREALIGRSVREEFPEAAGTLFETEYRRAIDTGATVRFEQHYPPLGRWFRVSAHPTPDGLAVYFVDVTEQRSQEQQMRLLEAAVARLNDIILITEAEPIDEPDGPRVVYVNEAFERRTGFSRDEVIGQTPRILQGPRTDRAELDRMRRALEEWQPFRSELVNYSKSGEEFWLELDIVPLGDESGKITHWIAVERDITERKLVEQTLQLSEERFRLVTKSAGSAIYDLDVVNGHQWWSEGLQDIFGHESNLYESLAAIRREHIHPDDMQRTESALERLISGQVGTMQEQYRFLRGDGSWAFVEENAFSIRDEDGEVSRVMGSMTDVTERTILEDRLRHAQKMESVGQLTGGVAHDFNNILTIILGTAEMLEVELADLPNLQKLAIAVIQAAERGAQLTNRLLAFSRKQPLETRVLDVASVIQGMDDLLRRTLPESIDIEMVRSGGLWKIETDAAQLEAAVLNLVLNARDAMPNGGSITIEVANATLDDDYVATEAEVRAGQYVLIAVTDTGQGMPPDVVSQVFEPFFTTKEAGRGSGLGMSMVYGFVKQSGGHIRVYSELGEGTSCKMYFPRCRTKHGDLVTGRLRRRTTGGTETILVAEDDTAVREHVATQLKSLGYHVLDVSTGAEAMNVVRSEIEIDLLFTDVVMTGGMDGRELADAALSIRPRLKILFTSGYTENAIIHNGRLDPDIKLLSKPYRRETLAAKVRDALDD